MTPPEVEEALALYAAGVTVTSIAERFGVRHETVLRQGFPMS
jgi:phage regulator Rha-like protein